MKNIIQYIVETNCNEEILKETYNLIANDMINESFHASILTNLAKAIKNAEAKHRENDAKQRKLNKEQGYSDSYMANSAKSFASIFGPITEIQRYGGKKTGIRGLKWSEIKDEDFQYFEADSDEWNKKFVKLLRSVYQKKSIADVICCDPGTKNVVCFIKGYAKTLGDVRVYYFANGKSTYKNGVQEKTATKYKFGERALKFDEAIDVISGYDIYFLEIKEDMIKDYDELHKEREESKKGMINLDDNSLRNLLKQQQARYNVMVKEIKAKKLQDDPSILFNEIKNTNDEVVDLFQKVMAKPENMDQRFDLDDLMRYVSYAYEQFYKSMKYLRDSQKDIEKWGDKYKDAGRYDKDQSNEAIRDAKEYVQKVRKKIDEIKDQLK